MAGKEQSGGKGKVPPRPGASRPAVPKRPTAKAAGGYGTGKPGRPVPRASARRAVQQRRQRNLYTAYGAVAVVIVVIAVIVGINLAGGSKAKAITKGGAVVGTFPLTTALFNEVANVPAKTLIKAAEAEPSYTQPPDKLPAGNQELLLGGKPEIFYLGAEYCPFCAAERWALVMALSKFGTFHNVMGTTSSSTDVNPSTPTFSFYKSTYTSPYLSFVPVETETNTKATLQNPTAAQSALWEKWDVPPYVSAADEGSIPFIYLAGKYLVTAESYDASSIAGFQMLAAVSYMTSGTNTSSKGAEAVAGYFISDLCTLTHNQPAAVCNLVPTWLRGVTTSSPLHKGGSSVVKKK
jgi:thiol-disulfide isomerase/thioredoxin